MNRLAQSTSPYLLQHRDNPVDWYPWGDEAFERARTEDRPVFLSVGYSSCHWCHVMAHESFESQEVAAILNERFVSVKVDREERPDVDDAYMAAVQLSSGRGGWPMSVFMTPDKKPFFAGTYFPREDRGGYPGFVTICRHIADLWRSRRDEIEKSAQEFANGVAQTLGHPAPLAGTPFDPAFVDRAVRALSADFDEVHGGFGGAPKFPPHTAIDFLLRVAQTAPSDPSPSTARSSAQEGDLRERARHMALFTLEKMALGGIHDHVGGGFHRYSTDAEWHLPHFEKMLYDNALMLANYGQASRMLMSQEGEEHAPFSLAWGDTMFWLKREMTAPDKTLYSALDADSEGEEGRFYVWTAAELDELLGEDAASFKEAFGVSAEGNFADEATGHRSGANVLHARSVPDDRARAALAKLRQARETRQRPSLDDKAVISWNGLAIQGLAAFAEPAADAILRAEAGFGRLPHLLVAGEPSGEAFLEDYAAFALALFACAESRKERESGATKYPLKVIEGYSSKVWLAHAERLTREMVALFWDEEQGGFFSTSARHEVLFGRTKPVFDQPIPSGNALALRCLIEMGDLDRARKLLAWALGWMERAPQATAALCAAALPLLQADAVPARSATRELEVTIEPRELTLDRDGVGRTELLIQIPEGFHINGNRPPANWLVPTEVFVEPLKADIAYPEGDEYRGAVRISVAVAGSPNDEFEVRIRFQACTDSECRLPQERVLAGRIKV